MLKNFCVEMTHLTDDCSAALVQLDGPNRTVRNNGSDTTYHVLFGRAEFIFPETGHEKEVFWPGDTVHVPKGTVYSDVGHRAVMLAVSYPPYDSDRVDILQGAPAINEFRHQGFSQAMPGFE